MLSKLVVKDRHVHAIVVLPYAAGRTLNPRPLGCEIVVAADAAADVVFVIFGVENVVWGWFWDFDADFFLDLRVLRMSLAMGCGLVVFWTSVGSLVKGID